MWPVTAYFEQDNIAANHKGWISSSLTRELDKHPDVFEFAQNFHHKIPVIKQQQLPGISWYNKRDLPENIQQGGLCFKKI